MFRKKNSQTGKAEAQRLWGRKGTWSPDHGMTRMARRWEVARFESWGPPSPEEFYILFFSEIENHWGIGIQKIIQSKSHFKDTALVEIEEKVLIGNGEWREAVIFVRKLLQEIKQWDGGMDSKWMDSSYILQVEWTFKGGWPCRIRRWS